MRQRGLIKILGLSFLALVSIMAANVSTAQADWLILLNQQSVNSITLETTFPAIVILVPGLGLAIRCEGGSGTVTGSLSEESKKLSGSAEVAFTECSDLEFSEVCDVSSNGDPTGTIVAQASHKFGMEGETTFAEAESSEGTPFTDIVYTGEFCPLTEIDARITGTVKFTILNPLTDTKLKVVHLTGQVLFCGGVPADLHDGAGDPVLGSTTDADPNATTALHLVGPL